MQVFKTPAQSEMVYERKLEEKVPDILKLMRIATGKCCSVVTVSKFIEQSLLDLFHMMFPLDQLPTEEHQPPQVVEDTVKREIMVSIAADFSTNENRKRFLREVERELEAISSSGTAILLQVTFNETVSRFAAGLLFLFATVFDEVEFAATRIDHICFTFTVDESSHLSPILDAARSVRQVSLRGDIPCSVE